VIKKAMIDLEPVLGDGATMLLQIHDELIVECADAEVEAVSGVVRRVMEGVTELKVPLVVDVSTGKSLDAAK
jgi:DNA polymerase-1